jgi:two-component system cell cycle response regulator
MKGTVLIVEDDHTILRLVDAVLTGRGHQVVQVVDGPSALSTAQRVRPDAILLDIGLPGLDGFAVLTQLKEDPELRDVPVVMVTAWGEAEHVARALDRGAHDYVRKPFGNAELVARVEAALRVKELTDTLFADNQRLDGLARHDLVTALPNRRHLEEVLDRQAHACRRVGRTFSVALLDLDRFSTINADHGHEVGDLVLRGTGKRLRRRVRVSDVLGRWGGEEFLVVLPNTPLGGAGALAEDLRNELADQPLDTGEVMLPVTASFGVAEFDGTERPLELVARADAALYEAKRDGRNAVRLATTVSTPAPLMGPASAA